MIIPRVYFGSIYFLSVHRAIVYRVFSSAVANLPRVIKENRQVTTNFE
jgi:hypothetical protein